MKKSKLSLNDLKVKSFITSLQLNTIHTVKGGTGNPTCFEIEIDSADSGFSSVFANAEPPQDIKLTENLNCPVENTLRNCGAATETCP